MKNKLSLMLLGLLAAAAQGQMSTYCSTPPFVGSTVQPNILIAQDFTGSQMWRAYWTVNNGRYRPNVKHYGYFNPDSNYSYSSGRFYHNPAGPFPGNVLNWACMSRIDIARKVLIGGKAQSRTGAVYKLLGQGSGDGWGSGGRDTVTLGGTRYRIDKPNATQVTFTRVGGTSPGALIGTYNVAVDVRAVNARGVIQQISDKDDNGVWDEDVPRFGLMTYSSGAGIGRKIKAYCGISPLSAMVDTISNITPNGYTPVGNAVYEAVCYFSQRNNYWANDYVARPSGCLYDPMYDTLIGVGKMPVSCRRNFVLVITDGESNSDNAIASDASMPAGPFARNLYNYDGVNDNYDNCSSTPHHPADDYAYYGHITDIRTNDPSNPRYLPGKQTIDFFAISTFGEGTALLREVAKDGGFMDLDSNNVPSVAEYDMDNDGIPDNFYDAQDGYELEEAVRRTLLAMMARASAASAVSIVSGSTSGEGTAHQAYFQPVRIEGTNQAYWTGYLRALWIDRYGNLREDSHHAGWLDMKDNTGIEGDYIVQMYYDVAANPPRTKVRRYRDPDGRGGTVAPPVLVDEVELGDIVNVWNGGQWLYDNAHSSRSIKTFVDADNDGLVDAGEIVPFTTASAATLRPYLAATSNAQAETLIQYVRGVDYPNLRPRVLGGSVWKLGDIIYSTPAFAGKPTERYDQIYGDLGPGQGYADFYQTYRQRRNLVLVGANDGMIHAFNAGRFVANTDPTANAKGRLDPMSEDLGKELWAYVPKNLLPHLQWLPKTNYCHVYYQDLKIKITDVRIFPSDAVHPDGWGTILIAGMRFGGYPYTIGANTYRSAYVCIDITDPDNPAPLWEINAPDMGFTVSYPCVGYVDGQWFAVVGGGPTSFDGTSNRIPKIYVINIGTGQIVRTIATSDANCSIGDCISVDIDLNGNTDVFYFGTYGRWATAVGRMYRLVTNSSSAPGTWTLNTLIDVQRPITAGPVVAKDEFNKFWVFFGTGRYLNNNDEGDATDQFLVGIQDQRLDSTRNMAQLRNVTNIAVNGIDSVSYNGTSGPWINWSSFMNDMQAYKGWYRVLPVNAGKSERSTNKPVVIGGALLASTFMPSGDPCAYGGEGFLYALYYLTGTAFYNEIISSALPGAHGVGTGDNPIKVSLGAGQPSAPSIHIGASGEKTFIQTPTGAVINVGTVLPFNPRSGNLFWKQR
jgi:type IV pilus assembly protein PilY1